MSEAIRNSPSPTEPNSEDKGNTKPPVDQGGTIPPEEPMAEEQATAWGSPWSAAEGGWDGEDMPAQGGGSTPPPPHIPGADASPAQADPPAPYEQIAPPAPQPTPADGNERAEQLPPTEKPMTLMDHLGELRMRLVRCCIAVGLAFAACYGVADLLFNELCRPLVAALPPGSKLIFTALPEAFFVYLQVGFVAAIFVASPYIFYQIWAFVAPGLYEDEKKYMIPIAACSALFFLAGACFCFFVVFPFAFTFFVGFATEEIAAMPSLKEYLGFALKLLIAFGLIFEMPLFTFFLARMGMVTAALMRSVRRYAILVIFIVAAILTPPDVMSQLLMAVPMIFLYELSIWVAVAFGRQKKNAQAAEANIKDSPATDSQKAQENTP